MPAARGPPLLWDEGKTRRHAAGLPYKRDDNVYKSRFAPYFPKIPHLPWFATDI